MHPSVPLDLSQPPALNNELCHAQNNLLINNNLGDYTSQLIVEQQQELRRGVELAALGHRGFGGPSTRAGGEFVQINQNKQTRIPPRRERGSADPDIPLDKAEGFVCSSTRGRTKAPSALGIQHCAGVLLL